MKLVRVLLATGASLAALSGLSAMESNSHFGERYMHHYYQNPQPQDLITAVNNLDQNGFLNTSSNREQAIGFLAAVFERNPGSVKGWLETSSRVLATRGQRLMAAAAYFANKSQGRTVAPTVITSEATLNLQLGEFMATGDHQYIDNIFTAVASDDSGLSTTAKFALAQSAASDPVFMQVCQTELARQPASVRETFEAALNDTTGRKPGA